MYRLNYYLNHDNKSMKLIFETESYNKYFYIFNILNKCSRFYKVNNAFNFHYKIYVPNYSFLLSNLDLPLEILNEIESYCASHYEIRNKEISNFYDFNSTNYFLNYNNYDSCYILYENEKNIFLMKEKCFSLFVPEKYIFRNIAKFKLTNLNIFELFALNLYLNVKEVVILVLLNIFHFILISFYTFATSYSITLFRIISFTLFILYILDFFIN